MRKGLLIVAITGVCLLLASTALRVALVVTTSQPALRLSPHHVAGIDLVVNDIPYTLNFDQQEKVIDALNTAIVIENEPANKETPFDRLVVHRFSQSPLVFSPIGMAGKELVLTDNEGLLLRDSSAGELVDILNGAHG